MQLKFFDKNHSDVLNILELAMEFLTVLYKVSLLCHTVPADQGVHGCVFLDTLCSSP